MSDQLVHDIATYLEQLCSYPDRHVGGEGNQAANALCSEVLQRCGFEVQELEFDCLEWERGVSRLSVGDMVLEVHPGPYSRPFEGTGPLRLVSTETELEESARPGDILVVHGPLAKGQLTPKNYPFYSVESHQRIVEIIERVQPAAIVAATPMNPAVAGGVYPFPWIEDGDLEIPHSFVKDVEGERLLAFDGVEASLYIVSRPVPARGVQLVARKPGSGAGRIVVFAHIDSKDGSPGALDNAAGVAALLGLATLLKDFRPTGTIEIVPLNGEDYYAASGHMVYLGQPQGLDDVEFGINVDGAGFRDAVIEYSTYGVAPEFASLAGACAERFGLAQGEAWVQGDHSLLVMRGIPALAVTSSNVFFIASTVAHTERDLPALVDPASLERVSRFMAALIEGACG